MEEEEGDKDPCLVGFEPNQHLPVENGQTCWSDVSFGRKYGSLPHIDYFYLWVGGSVEFEKGIGRNRGRLFDILYFDN